MWFKNTYGIASRKYHFLSYVAWVRKTNCELANVQYHFFSSCMNWKNHLRVQKCATSFSSSLAWIKITTCRLISVQYHFFLSHVNFLKTTCRPTSVEYHFFSTLMWIGKNQNICAISFFFFIYMNKKIHLWAHKC